MRSFSARSDTTCWDEPFFAAFLHRTGLDHPGRDETLAACERNAERVAERIVAPAPKPYHFQKHMAHHMIDGIPRDWIGQARHVLILRHPARVIASYAKGRPDFTVNDLGFSALRDIYAEIETRIGRSPLVLETDAVLTDPETAMRRMCEDGFDIAFDPAMLRWAAGTRPEDGPWAPYWYDNVMASTGFGQPPGDLPPVSPTHASIFTRCMEDYSALLELT